MSPGSTCKPEELIVPVKIISMYSVTQIVNNIDTEIFFKSWGAPGSHLKSMGLCVGSASMEQVAGSGP